MPSRRTRSGSVHATRLRRGRTRVVSDLFTSVYTGGVPEDRYSFTEQSYQRLAWAGVSPLAVAEVLYGEGVVRRHIGSSLQVFGEDSEGSWLVVALVETNDDDYEVTGARYLDEDEIAAIKNLRGRRDR